MCKHALIYAPFQRHFSKDGEEVMIQGFLLAEGISEERIALFEKDVLKGRRVERPLPWIEVRRTVKVASHEGLRNQAAKLGVEIREYFTPDTMSYH